MIPARQTWRNTSLLGLVFCVVVVNGMLGSALLFGFTANSMGDSIEGRHQPVFDDPSPATHPLVFLFSFLQVSAFIVAALLHLIRGKLFIRQEAGVLHQLVYSLSLTTLVLGFLLAIFFTYSQLYSATLAEARLTTLLTAITIYFYVWAMGIAGVLFGIEIYRQKQFPRWLALTTVISDGLALLVNLLAPHPDLPAFRLIIGIPFLSLELIVWTFFLWLAASAGDPEKTTLL